MTLDDGGWQESAQAWIARVNEGDMNRELVLDPAMLEIWGDVRGLRVCDVGCGEGRSCRKLRALGAEVVGIDPTPALIDEAKRRDPDGTYIGGFAENLPLEDNSFDLVVSYVTLVDITDYKKAIAEMARILKPGGRLIAANLNSFATSVPTGWIRNEADEKVVFPVDNYMEERPEWVEWCGIRIINWHRPLSAYMQAYLACGLNLRHFSEPLPSAEALERRPDYTDYFRVPYFNVMAWEKPV
jgi:SAM-dependent methyltransferase